MIEQRPEDDAPMAFPSGGVAHIPPPIDAYPLLEGPVEPPEQPEQGELVEQLIPPSRARYIYDRYLEVLAQTGDPVQAVSRALGVPVEEAEDNLWDFEERIIEAAGPDPGLEKMLKRHRANLPARIAYLGDTLHHGTAPARANAEKRLSEIEQITGTKKVGVKAEDLIRLALQKIADKKKQAS